MVEEESSNPFYSSTDYSKRISEFIESAHQLLAGIGNNPPNKGNVNDFDYVFSKLNRFKSDLLPEIEVQGNKNMLNNAEKIEKDIKTTIINIRDGFDPIPPTFLNELLNSYFIELNNLAHNLKLINPSKRQEVDEAIFSW